VTRIALSWLRQPLLSERPATANLRTRGLLFLLWLAVTLTLAINHVPWRDEARAWLLMLQGDSWGEMFRAVQGEGHPFLWYMLLRAGNDLFGTPDVLPVIGLLIGIPTVALLVFRAPFRLGLLAVLIFSLTLASSSRCTPATTGSPRWSCWRSPPGGRVFAITCGSAACCSFCATPTCPASFWPAPSTYTACWSCGQSSVTCARPNGGVLC
jgi:hypothetical protein